MFQIRFVFYRFCMRLRDYLLCYVQITCKQNKFDGAIESEKYPKWRNIKDEILFIGQKGWKEICIISGRKWKLLWLYEIGYIIINRNV